MIDVVKNPVDIDKVSEVKKSIAHSMAYRLHNPNRIIDDLNKLDEDEYALILAIMSNFEELLGKEHLKEMKRVKKELAKRTGSNEGVAEMMLLMAQSLATYEAVLANTRTEKLNGNSV